MLRLERVIVDAIFISLTFGSGADFRGVLIRDGDRVCFCGSVTGGVGRGGGVVSVHGASLRVPGCGIVPGALLLCGEQAGGGEEEIVLQ